MPCHQGVIHVASCSWKYMFLSALTEVEAGASAPTGCHKPLLCPLSHRGLAKPPADLFYLSGTPTKIDMPPQVPQLTCSTPPGQLMFMPLSLLSPTLAEEEDFDEFGDDEVTSTYNKRSFICTHRIYKLLELFYQSNFTTNFKNFTSTNRFIALFYFFTGITSYCVFFGT